MQFLECQWIIIYRFLCITSLMREILFLPFIPYLEKKCFGLATQIDLSVKNYHAIKLCCPHLIFGKLLFCWLFLLTFIEEVPLNGHIIYLLLK